jgi:hypothetical protein
MTSKQLFFLVVKGPAAEATDATYDEDEDDYFCLFLSNGALME